MLVVDQSGSTRFGDPVSKAGLEVEVAAVLALAAAHQNDRVGALLFAEAGGACGAAAEGAAACAARASATSSPSRPASKKTNLGASLTYTGRLLRHRSIVVVLSDFLATDWERPLRRLAARHEVVAVTVDDPRERTLPDAGRAVAGGCGDRASWCRSTRRRGARAMRWRATRSGAGWSARRMITAAGRRPGGPGRGAGLRAAPAAGVRGAGAPAASRVMLLLLALLQQGAPTVGDTIWLVRTVAVPSGSAVRPAAWNPTGDAGDAGTAARHRTGATRWRSRTRWWSGCPDRARWTCRARCCCSPAGASIPSRPSG